MSSVNDGVVGGDAKYSAGVPQTADKAKIAGILSAVGAAVVAWVVSYFTGGNDADLNTLWAAIVSALAVGVPTAGATFATKNKVARNRHV